MPRLPTPRQPPLPRPCAPLLLLCCLPPALGEAPRRDHALTVDDYFTLATPFEVALAPDGSAVAYTEGRWQKSTNDRKADLWVVECKGGKVRRLTDDRPGAHSPQWSADSRHVYFLASRSRAGEKRPPYDGKAQVWRVPAGGGNSRAITRVEGGVEMYRLARDGRSLCYVTKRPQVDGTFKALKEKFKDVEYGHGVGKVSVVGKLELEGWGGVMERAAKG